MSKLTKAVIEKLTENKAGKVVTIYLPTHRHPTPPHISEDQTRFKNMIHEAISQVEDDSDHDPQLINQLNELMKNIDDMEFWQSAIESMAIFVNSDQTEIYRLPIECEEYVQYSDEFVTAPLVMAESYNQKFYVLALAMHDSRLYEGDIYSMEEVDVDLPKNVESALNIDEMFANSQTSRSHQGGSAGRDNSTSSPHGEGDSNEAGTQERLKYFKIIEDKITSQQGFDPNQPLVVAGTDSESGDFCAHTKLKSIAPTVLRGNYNHLNHSQLHELVWPIIQKDYIFHKQQDALSKINELQGSGKASTKLGDIEEAVNEGRIEILVVPLIDQTHDSVTDRDELAPVIRMDKDHDGRLTKLVQQVYQLGGEVLGVDSETLADGVQAGAVYRY